MVESLEEAAVRLAGQAVRTRWYRRQLPRSAVAMILRSGAEGLDVLMIRRAERRGDPWSGHMAFPGGRAEPGDRDSLHTARRETLEEIGLNTRRHARYLGRLPDLLSPQRRRRLPMVIAPHLLAIDDVPPLRINEEVAEVCWVPLNFLADNKNRQILVWHHAGESYELPYYAYRGRQIWGLSLAMLDQLLCQLEN